MRIGWGWKITVLYGGFVAMMLCLVIASSHQNIDLVSKDYYKDEIKYQTVLDASKNQASLSGTLSVHADSKVVVIEFPAEFDTKVLSGSITFYSAANKDWDKEITINTGSNKVEVPRADLHPTIYDIKVSYAVDGKNFYYQTRLDLHTS